MEIPQRYCEECGAANAREATRCFACGRSLETVSAEHFAEKSPVRSSKATIVLSEQTDADLAAPARYMQITLSANSSTTVQIVQQPPQPSAPLLHGRYKVLARVGTGGFGAVYKARDMQAHGRMVAIKAIELDTLSASQAIEATDTFNRELNLLSNLDHPHLPNIYEHFIDETHWYLVMDFIDGEPLDEYLQQMHLTSLPLKQVITIGLQLCDVLRYLHQLQPPVIFRDLKPANIMLTPGGRLYLIDFGIARRFKPGQLKDTTPLGSPGFASPEQYGRAQTTPRSDIYSLGATLYFLLTGYDPANTPFHLPPIRSLCPQLPEPLAELITSMLELDPAQRPANISVIHHILSNYGRGTRHTTVLAPTQVANVANSPAPPAKPPLTQRWKGFFRGAFSIALTIMIFGACTLTAHLMGSASMTAAYNNGDYPGPPPAPPAPSLVRVPYIGQLRSLNPFSSSGPQAMELENLLFGRLVNVYADGFTVQSGLASSWVNSNDHLTWTFYLKPSATFSDGAPVTAQDVAASLNYALASASADTCPFAGLMKDAKSLQEHQRSTLLGDSIVVIDATTLSLTTSRPVPYLLATLATPCGSIFKKSDLSGFDLNNLDSLLQIAFSGNYTLTGYAQPNGMTSLSFSAVQTTADRYPSMPAQITVQSYADDQASYAAYNAGQIDTSPVASIHLGLSQDIRYTHPLTLHYYAMNFLAKPFDSIPMRKAFALALDKDTLAAFSHGTPTSSLLGYGLTYDSAADNNPTVAQELFQQGLAEEGLSSAAQLKPITFAYQAGEPNLALEVTNAKKMWETLFGVKINLQASNHLTQTIAATRGNTSLQLWAADYTPAYLDPYAQVGLPFAPGSPLNAVNYGQNTSSHAAQQQALQQSLAPDTLASMNDTQRLQLYQAADPELAADVAWLPIYRDSQPYVIRSSVANIISGQWTSWEASDACVLLPPC